ncbi:MAG: hypothetical protein ACYDCD_01845 [Candidatus Acidiferrales bacterium]
MNKLLMLVVLVLLVLTSAVGIRNLTANQTASQRVASTGMPMPAAPYLVASTGMPMPAAPYMR